MAAPSPGSSSSRVTATATAPASSWSTTKPVTPSSTASQAPPLRPATAGTPQAAAVGRSEAVDVDAGRDHEAGQGPAGGPGRLLGGVRPGGQHAGRAVEHPAQQRPGPGEPAGNGDLRAVEDGDIGRRPQLRPEG